jgi:hypothetical protein
MLSVLVVTTAWRGLTLRMGKTFTGYGRQWEYAEWGVANCRQILAFQLRVRMYYRDTNIYRDRGIEQISCNQLTNVWNSWELVGYWKLCLREIHLRVDGGWNWAIIVATLMNSDVFWGFTITVIAIKVLKQLISCCILLCKSLKIIVIYILYI